MGLSCLTDPTAAIVIDASTAINLNGSGYAATILKALPNRVLIADIVAAELEEGRRTGRRDSELIAALSKDGLVEVLQMNDREGQLFESLVIGGTIDTLDDGEAATIAVAWGRGAIAIIDERKANRICAQRHPEVRIGCTIDLFAHDSVQNDLGCTSLCDAVFSALQHARMRVPARYIEWVVGLIGQDRVRLCPSLPNEVRTRHSTAKV
jgi:predicted nucleic acid-binding protein